MEVAPWVISLMVQAMKSVLHVDKASMRTQTAQNFVQNVQRVDTAIQLEQPRTQFAFPVKEGRTVL